MINFCPQCGEKQLAGANFCSRCGADFRTAAHATSESAAKAHPPIIAGADSTPQPATDVQQQVAPRVASAWSKFFSAKLASSLVTALLVFLTVSVLAGPIIFIAAGHKIPGQMAGGLFLWVLFSTAWILRRRKHPWLTAVTIAIGSVTVLAIADGLVNRQRYALERIWSENPTVAAIRNADSKGYDALVAESARILRANGDSPKAQQQIVANLQSKMKEYLARSPDDVLLLQYQAKHRHLGVLMQRDISLCYTYIWGGGPNATDTLKRLPEDIRAENNQINARVIQSARGDAIPVDVGRAERALTTVYDLATQRLGGDKPLLQMIEQPSGDYAGTCRAMFTFTGSLIDSLSQADAANLIRYLNR